MQKYIKHFFFMFETIFKFEYYIVHNIEKSLIEVVFHQNFSFSFILQKFDLNA
jgi:hypothetical protein